ncbi:uncharacterized protein LOC123553904 [Mercenaria mercenaria]|uniref:uncharacterized protein LOC123553904 n=1 Tax=Mercenaria mercenaria TaxID=6596 RepID=UPI00234E6F9D|nr:uncharacterized protein LOC123553904 [Mercenaria mercenaria]
MDDEIAVVGIGCRFPGADNIDEFWRVLVEEENHVVDIPTERWNNDAFYSDDKDEPDKLYVKKAAFINSFDKWDNKLFGISDNEAAQIDPQQRHVLECTHMAMEDGGITRKQLSGSSTGVYIGAMGADYKTLFDFDHSEDTNYTVTGASGTILASRVSYVYNLQGPCMVIDTACSSSGVAMHLGSQAIRTGDCDMAICGGVNLMLSPGVFQSLSRAKMLSPTCQCHAFCDTADGYVRGEGCGIVILKSYTKAVEDDNKIWGIIKTGTNQDGRMALPITAPSGEQQEKLLNKLYSQHMIDPSALQYIECHGTGTPTGDPTEVNAIGKFIDSYRKKQIFSNEKLFYRNATSANKSIESNNFTGSEDVRGEVIRNNSSNIDKNDSQGIDRILIGSVKTNIGHLESAAGVAGLIKVLLMMKYCKFVPSLHVKRDKSNLNRNINFNEYGLDVALEVKDWRFNSDGERIACVNSFGFGGSNSHVIVIQKRTYKLPEKLLPKRAFGNKYAVICISAGSKQTLKLALKGLEDDLSKYSLEDVSYTSIFRRDHYAYRTLVFGRNVEGVREDLQQKLHLMNILEKTNRLRLIFVFSGVGTTWTGMCKEMMETQPVFRSTVSKIDYVLKPLTGWTITEKFDRVTDYDDPLLNHIALFCMQVALFKQWQCWGIEPDAIIGQSVGEVAAAYASGALTLDGAVSVIYARSKALSSLKSGKMMVVSNYDCHKLEELCLNYKERVEIAVYNSSISCTLSGDSDVIECIKRNIENINEKENTGILLKILPTQCAYHSHHVESCLDNVERQLRHIDTGQSRIEHYSTVTGQLAVSREFKTGRYWAENIRKPVQFMQSVINAVHDDAMNVFVEIGPKPVLKAHLNNVITDKRNGICIPSMRENSECASFFSSLSSLYELGANVQWENVSISGNLVPVARYIQTKERRLDVPVKHQAMLKGYFDFSDSHMFVRRNGGNETKFQMTLDQRTTPFIFEHFFSDTCIVPGAVYVEAAIEVGQRTLKNHNAYELSISAEFVSILSAEKGRTQNVDIIVTGGLQKRACYYEVMHGRQILCRGTINDRVQQEREKLDLGLVKSRCYSYKNKVDCYEYLERMFFSYGASLRIIEQTWSSPLECLAEIELPELVKLQSKQLNIHPNVIDGLFQMVVVLHHEALDNYKGDPDPFFPKEIGSIVLYRPCKSRMFAYARLMEKFPTGHLYNFLLVCPDGHVIAEVQDFFCRKMHDSVTLTQSKYCDILWQETTPPYNTYHKTSPVDDGTLCVIGSDRFLENIKQTNVSDITYISLKQDEEFCIEFASSKTKAFLFAPFFHVNELVSDSIALYQTSKQMMMYLLHIIRILQRNKYESPLYVITENVVSAPVLQISAGNVCGAELWGMVRSAVSENAYRDIRLVDMTLTAENITALTEVLDNSSAGYNEYLINRGKVYYCEVVEVPVDTKMCRQRNISHHCNYNLSLKSARQDCLYDPWYRFTSMEVMYTKPDDYLKIRLNKMCLHDSDLYPVSSYNNDDDYSVWLPEGSGFQAICLEGVGVISDETDKDNFFKKEVVFCSPVDVTSYVYVPKECVHDIEGLNGYVPGMLTEAVILWNMFSTCRKLDCVAVIVDGEKRIWISLIRHMLSNLGATKVTIKPKDYLTTSVRNGTSDTQVVVVLTDITRKHFEKVPFHFPVAKQIISTDSCIPRLLKLWIERHVTDHPVDILRTESMFHASTLKESLPQIFGILESHEINESGIQKNLNHYEDNRENRNVFNLPHLSLQLQEYNGGTKQIPLKVCQSEVFRPNACYIVVGGLTGLGWELTQYMAELGAGYIATISRHLPSQEKRLQIEKLKMCKIIPLQGDVTDIRSLQKAFEFLQTQIFDVPIKGVFHGAGVICDQLLENMSIEDLEIALLPKVLGTWNLHFLTLEMSLDFFVMQSSIVSVIGNQGQCNYAAGNSFQDSFAHYRQSLGLCGTSINWSALSVGMATYDKKLEVYLKNKGVHLLSTNEIRSCFIRSIMENSVQVIFGQIDWERLLSDTSTNINANKFARIIKHNKQQASNSCGGKRNIVDVCSDLNPQDKRNVVMELIKSEVAKTFVLDGSILIADSRFASLGIDSMAAMSFTNSMYEATGVRIPTGNMFSNSASIGTVTDYVLQFISKGSSTSYNKTDKKATEGEIKFLEGSITFMQKSVLLDYEEDPHSPDLIRQAAWEFAGMQFSATQWKVVLKYLLKMNPDMRRIYKKQADGKYESFVLKLNDVNDNVEEIDYESREFSEDCRGNVSIDLSKEIPIRLKIGRKNGRTRLVMFMHAIVTDLFGIGTLIQEIRQCVDNNFQEPRMSDKDNSIEPAEVVRSALIPKMNVLKKYWKDLMSHSIRPFTLGKAIKPVLDRNSWREISKDISVELIDMMTTFIHKEEITLYNFLTSVYMFLLYERTGCKLIPLITNADMRSHLPRLHSVVTRCANEIPILGDLRNVTTIKEYIKASSKNLHETTTHSIYPYQLIEREFKTAELKKYIGRHRLIMNNMTNLTKSMRNTGLRVEDINMFYKRHIYETALSVVYDTDAKSISLQFGYNSDVLRPDYAAQLPSRLISLIQIFIENPDISLKDVKHRSHPRPDCSFNAVRTEDTEDSNTADHAMMQTTDDIAVEKSITSKAPVFKDCFRKLSSTGKEHTVQLQLFQNGSNILLSWRGKDDVQDYGLPVQAEDATLTNLNGEFNIRFSVPDGLVQFKTSSSDKATALMATLKREH